MKITELFNNTKEPVEKLVGKMHDNDATISHKPDHKSDHEYTFDLSEDLEFFMHNNDDFYRRHFFPTLKICKAKFDNGAGFSHRLFKPVIVKAYETYKKEFPIRELPDNLDDELCEKMARRIYETELGNFEEGQYD